jgi:hypothetical protein
MRSDNPESGEIQKIKGSYGSDDVAFHPDGRLYLNCIIKGEVGRRLTTGEMGIAGKVKPGNDGIAISKEGRVFVSGLFLDTHLWEIDPDGKRKRSTARKTLALAVPSGRRRSSRRNPESLSNTTRSRMMAVCRSVRRFSFSFSSNTDAMSWCQSSETTLRHDSVSGTLGFAELARAWWAGQGDFIFAYGGVAVANMDHANVYGCSSDGLRELCQSSVEVSSISSHPPSGRSSFGSVSKFIGLAIPR